MASREFSINAEGTQVTAAEGCLRLCCPFYQHDKTSCKQSKACKGPGFEDITRLREHLKRSHRETRPTLTSMPKLDELQWGRVLAAIADSRHKSLAERWIAVYKAIFPEEERLPFCPTMDDLIAEASSPSESYLTNLKASMASDPQLRERARSDSFLRDMHRSMHHAAIALRKTGGRQFDSTQPDSSLMATPSTPSIGWPSVNQMAVNSHFHDAMETPSGGSFGTDDSDDQLFDTFIDPQLS